jgi:hypothetical protein
MELKRRTERNNIETSLKQTINYNDRDKKTINRLNDLNDRGYDTICIKLKNNLKERDVKVEELTRRLTDLKTGLLDDELIEEAHRQENIVKMKVLETKKKKIILKNEKAKDKAISQKYWDETIASTRQFWQKKRDTDRGYRYFLKICDSLPNYIRRNLSEMPNNKGYIWRGMFCYGNLPAQKNHPIVLFDKSKRDVMFIHEWSDNEYKVFKKEGRYRKILIQKTNLTKKKHSSSLLDYVKKEKK